MPSLALAQDPIQDVADCLRIHEDMDRLAADFWLQADSVGFLAAGAGERPSASLLRQAEELQRQYSEMGVDLCCSGSSAVDWRKSLWRRAKGASRSLVDAAGTRVRRRSRRRAGAAPGPEAGAAGQSRGASGVRVSHSGSGLRRHRRDPEAKLQYYGEVSSLLAALEGRISERRRQVQEEAEGFARRGGSWKTSFTDMGIERWGPQRASTRDKP
ncbi:MAG: hypothetical protein R3E12_05730 [Candidatus Eisenbacteria bacterium]